MPVDFSNKNSYDILGLSPYSDDAAVYARYKELKERYSEERFLPGERGNEAASMLEAVEHAYAAIVEERKARRSAKQEEQTQSQEGVSYDEVDRLIREGKYDEAQLQLDNFSERLAEWHYLQAVVYYKKNWSNESKKQLEIALRKEPNNKKYKETYEKLCKEMEYKSQTFTSADDGQEKTQQRDFDPDVRQMGGNDCMTSCCQCLACNALLNCCCNCR